MAQQLGGPLMPIQQVFPPSKAREITDEERKISVFNSMRVARANARLAGVRAVKAKKAAEEAAQDPLKKK